MGKTSDWIDKRENGHELFAVTSQPNIINEKMLILSKEQIVEVMKSDEKIQAIIEHLDKAGAWTTNISRYQRYRKELYEQDGLLMKKEKMVLPASLRYPALKIAHHCHPGMSSMKHILRQGVWWPAMDADIEEFVKSCPSCQLITEDKKPPPIVLTRLPENVWDRVSVDFSTPSGVEGWKAIVLIDQYSRYLIAIPMKKTDTEAVKRVLKRIFQTYHFPKELLLDNGPPFNSKELKTWIESYGIKYSNTTPLNPSENGLVERGMAGINKVATIARLEKRSFDESLLEYVTAYNSWPHHSTKIPPSQLMFGRAVRSFLPNSKTEFRQREDDDFRKQDMELKMRRNQHENMKRHAGVKDIRVGDTVLVKNQKGDKADTTYTNCFFEVIDISGGRVTVKDKATDKTFQRSIKHLKKYMDPKSIKILKELQYFEDKKDNSMGKEEEYHQPNVKSSNQEPGHNIENEDEQPVKRYSGRIRRMPKRFLD